MDTTQEIYLDNSATTRVSKEAAEKALYMMTECYGNPSSLHSKGFAAEKEMTAAREIIAERLSAQPGEIYFTSGGTESDNIAILGAAHAKKRALRHAQGDGGALPRHDAPRRLQATGPHPQ